MDVISESGSQSSQKGLKRKRDSDNQSFGLLNKGKQEIMRKVKKMKTSFKLKLPCISTNAVLAYDSDCQLIPSSQLTNDEKCTRWLNNN